MQGHIVFKNLRSASKLFFNVLCAWALYLQQCFICKVSLSAGVFYLQWGSFCFGDRYLLVLYLHRCYHSNGNYEHPCLVSYICHSVIPHSLFATLPFTLLNVVLCSSFFFIFYVYFICLFKVSLIIDL